MFRGKYTAPRGPVAIGGGTAVLLPMAPLSHMFGTNMFEPSVTSVLDVYAVAALAGGCCVMERFIHAGTVDGDGAACVVDAALVGVVSFGKGGIDDGGDL